jgi:hypothetical protein
MTTPNDADRDFGSSDCSSFRWPRGRYNGKRIVGASIKFKFSVEYFEWRPKWIKYANCLRWLWFYLWIEWEYE